MNKITHILIVGFLGLTACTNSEFEKGEGGLLYKIHEDRSGETIKEDDFMGLTYTERTEEDSIIYNSNDYDGRQAIFSRKQSAFKGDLNSAFGMLSEGDSATFKINLDSIVAKEGRSKPNTKSKYIIYTVKVHKVIARGQMDDEDYNSAIERYKAVHLDLAKNQEVSKFRNFLSSLKTKPTETASGLNYIIEKEGEGRKAILGDTVILHYTVRYLSGKIAETSDEEVAKREGFHNKLIPYQDIKMLIKHEKTLSGFKESLRLFPKGTKARLIIPSRLAYGTEGHFGIQPYTGILCDLEILDIISPKAGAKSPIAKLDTHVH